MVNESAIFEIQAKEMQHKFTAMCKTNKKECSLESHTKKMIINRKFE